MTSPARQMIYHNVALPVAINRLFCYSSPTAIPLGSRVKVIFSGRPLIGVVHEHAAEIPVGFDSKKIRSIAESLDEEPVFSQSLRELAAWLSHYYQYPLGEVYRTMLPAGSISKRKREVHLLLSFAEEVPGNLPSSLGSEADFDHRLVLKKIFSKRTQLQSSTFEKKVSTELGPLARSVVERWTRLKWIESSNLRDHAARLATAPIAGEDKGLEAPQAIIQENQNELEKIFEHHLNGLNAEQTEAVKKIMRIDAPAEVSGSTSSNIFLLQGVTGSGKTEVFLRSIRLLLDPAYQRFIGSRGDIHPGQVIFLVPEISLTPQMQASFMSVFGAEVGVVHSQMSDSQRWEILSRFRSGELRVLLGPRSTVFASGPYLRMIFVDEEHDGSYKQQTGLSYNARDVAVYRAHLENLSVVLASATPSLESYLNAKQKKYQLLEMKQRFYGAAMPAIDFVAFQPKRRAMQPLLLGNSGSLRQEQIEVTLSPQIEESLKANFLAGQQSCVILNRRGFSYYLYNVQTQDPVGCPRCSLSLHLHRRMQDLRCHTCGFYIATRAHLSHLAQESERRLEDILATYVAVGYGSEKLELHLQQLLPGAKVARLDSDVAAKRGYLEEVLDSFREEKIDILVGTQMLTKGHDFGKLSLIVVIDIDAQLDFADFRAGEKVYQMLVQSAGRAGRRDQQGTVLIQTAKPQNPLFAYVKKQNFHDYAQSELQMRKTHGFPPFVRMILHEYKFLSVPQLKEFEDFVVMESVKSKMDFRQCRVLGPIIPQIEKVDLYTRRFFMFSSVSSQVVHKQSETFLRQITEKFPRIKFRVDVDPQHFL